MGDLLSRTIEENRDLKAYLIQLLEERRALEKKALSAQKEKKDRRETGAAKYVVAGAGALAILALSERAKTAPKS